MKEEQRKVYVADDGTPFIHRYECISHERKLKNPEPPCYSKLFHSQEELIEFANNFNSDNIIWDKWCPVLIFHIKEQENNK